MKNLLILALTLQASGVISDDWNPASDCLDGITTDITSFGFSDVETGDYYATMCNGTPSTTSMWAAAKLYCSEQEIEVGERLVAGWCEEYGSTILIPYAEVKARLTDDFITSLPVVKYEDIAVAQKWNTSIVISKDLFMAGFKTSRVWNEEYRAHHRYGWAVFGFWGGVILIGTINRIIGLLSRSQRIDSHNKSSEPLSATRRVTSDLNRWVRANLIIPTTFGTRHRQPVLWCTIPIRMETLIIFLFWVVNIGICCATCILFSPNLYYTRANRAWRYISDRTGRNNIFIWLTGWSFQTFNIFHRHIARLAVVQAIVHSISYSVLEASEGQLTASWKENYWYMGGVATIAMYLLLVVSSMFFRQHTYEVFLLLHIGFSVLTLVGLFYHVAIFDGEYNPYLWILVAIWGIDRTARLARWAYCNLNIRFWRGPKTTTAIASYDAGADLIRLSVIPGSNALKPGTGQHYFLYHFRQLLGWENHPFTLATSSDGTISEVATIQAEIGLESKSSATKETTSSEVSSLEVQQSSRYMTFLIRPYAGWTKRLKNQCVRSNTGSLSFNMCIEGPYGHRSPLYTFENVLFVVGGTGISGALPYLQEYLEGTRKTSVTSNIRLVWAAKQSLMLQSLANRELRPFAGRSEVEIELHCTREQETSVSKATGFVDQQNLHFGRPDVVRTIVDFVESTPLGERVAVLACGPAGMADDARAAVRKVLKEGKRSVEYFEETFGW